MLKPSGHLHGLLWTHSDSSTSFNVNNLIFIIILNLYSCSICMGFWRFYTRNEHVLWALRKPALAYPLVNDLFWYCPCPYSCGLLVPLLFTLMLPKYSSQNQLQKLCGCPSAALSLSKKLCGPLAVQGWYACLRHVLQYPIYQGTWLGLPRVLGRHTLSEVDAGDSSSAFI